MLIVEGTDGVGKTTLCKKLLTKLHTHIYAHFTRLPPGFDYFWGYVERMSRHVVQDRFHMSEVAYAVARGEPPHIDPDQYALVDARLRLIGGFTVVVTAEPSLVKERWRADQMYNLGATLEAGRMFIDIVSRPNYYRADVDYHFHCEEGENEYVPNTIVDDIVERYRERLRLTSEVASWHKRYL